MVVINTFEKALEHCNLLDKCISSYCK